MFVGSISIWEKVDMNHTRTQALFLGIVMTSLMWFAGFAVASDDRVDHFQGQSADTIEQALMNLEQYNARFSEILNAGEMDAETSYEIHQLTYTLENALERLETELGVLQEHLEAVHLASEANDTETQAERGRAYLRLSEALFSHSTRQHAR